MRVRIETSFIFNGEAVDVGDVVEMEDGNAEQKIRSGWVKKTDAPVGKAKKNPSKSTTPPAP